MTNQRIGLDAPVKIEADRSRCVLCGEPNDCGMEKRTRGETTEDPCWCVDQKFPVAMTRIASERDGGASCICAACLAAGQDS